MRQNIIALIAKIRTAAKRLNEGEICVAGCTIKMCLKGKRKWHKERKVRKLTSSRRNR